MRLKDCYNFKDFRKLAKKKLPSPIFHYIDGAADDEITYKRNTSAFDDVDLVPNVLRGVENVDLSTTIFGKNSVYVYTGIEAQYNLGPMKIAPSFTPGYYEKGGGKDLGSALEFKSEISLSLDIFEDTQIGYSYNHISNNDWGSVNPGTDNQIISFSTKF